MSDLPFMPLYVSDYLADTTHLSTEAHGAYLLILMVLWKVGGELPADDKTLSRITRLSPRRWLGVKDDVLAFFTIANQKISHNRVQKEIENAKTISEKRSTSGKLGAEAKALKRLEQEQANASRLLAENAEIDKQNSSKTQASHTSHITVEEKNTLTSIPKNTSGEQGLPLDAAPSSKPKPRKPSSRKPYSELFEEFWAAYPVTSGMPKFPASKAFEKLTPDEQRLAIDATPAWRDYVKKNASWYTVQHAATWLNQKRFESLSQAVPQDLELWTKRMDAARKMNTWGKDWGPFPRKHGCEVPKQLLRDSDGEGWTIWNPHNQAA